MMDNTGIISSLSMGILRNLTCPCILLQVAPHRGIGEKDQAVRGKGRQNHDKRVG